jgi:galactose oxidase-like protein
MPWLRKACVLIAGVTLGVGSAVVVTQASPPAPNWGQASPNQSPPGRQFAAMTYDTNHARTVLFGGGNSAFVNLADTWLFDGTNWVQSNPSTSPPALVGSAMAFDSNRNFSVLFGGGTSSGNSSDTWEWDGTTWAKRAIATAPPARLWSTMAFDSARGEIVLFGGSGSGGAEFGDTWTYDGTAWTLKSPSSAPSARYGAAMAFDPGLGRVVLFGGRSAGTRMADTWEWDGTNWTQFTPSSAPFPRFWHSMAYDPQVGHVVVFGGDHIEPFGLGPINDTWAWDGAQWTQNWTSAAPSVRAGQTMALDVNGRIAMFGGSDEGNPGTFPTDTWELGTGITTPPGNPAVTFNPTSGEFGQVNVGSTSGAGRFNVSSSGTGPLVATISTTGDFAVSSTTCPSAPNPLAAGSFCKVFITFSPTAPGDRFGSLVFTDNGPGGSQSVPLHGTGVGSDFTISANPTTLNMLQGTSATDSISTTVLGTAGTVALSALTTDPGLTATFNPSSVTAGGGATMTVTVGSSVPTGPQSVRVVGTEGSTTHTVDVAVNVSAPPDFSISASPSSVSIKEGSSSTIAINTAITSGGSQSVALSASGLPAGATASFSQTPIASGSSSALTLTTALSTPAGTYTVTVTGTGTSTTHTTTVSLTVTPALVNGGFETGNFTGWTTTGVTAIVKTPHTGTFSARVGSTSPSKTSTLSQTFAIPASGGNLSFYFRMTCRDTVTYDWFTVTLHDNATGKTTTLQPRVCSNKTSWTHVTTNLSSNAGHSVTLTFENHDDNFPGDPTYTLVDDVSLT